VREMGQSAWLSTSCLSLQGWEARVNAMETRIGCNDRILWSNNYSILPCAAADGSRSHGNRAFARPHRCGPVCPA